MDGEGPAAGVGEAAHEGKQLLIGIAVVDADAGLDRDGQARCRDHGAEGPGDELGLRHETGAEPRMLHAVARTAEIEIDLVIAERLGNGCACRQGVRVGAAELQRHRMLGRIETEQTLAVAAQHRAGRDHLGIKQGPPAQQPQEIAAMTVRALHHRRDGEPAVEPLSGRLLGHRATVTGGQDGKQIRQAANWTPRLPRGGRADRFSA